VGDRVTLPDGATVSTTAGSDVLFASPGTGIDWTALGIFAGDVIEIDCASYRIKNVLNNIQLQLESTLVANSTGTPVAVYRGNVKTAAFGTFEVQGDVTL